MPVVRITGSRDGSHGVAGGSGLRGQPKPVSPKLVSKE